MELTDEHIAYIKKDLIKQGLILEGLHDEVLDHICSLVEEKMESGIRFTEAYRQTIRTFGNSRGLQETQYQIISRRNTHKVMMLKNNFIVAWRNLRRQSFYSLINITGLAIGIAACLVIVLYVINELSYDRFYTKADRIFRINHEIKFGDNHFEMATSSAPVAHTLLQDYPEIESAVRFSNYGTFLVKTENSEESIKENRVFWADSTVFTVFDLPVLHGNPKTALKEPYCVAISASTSAKYFPNGNAVGQTLILDNDFHTKVTAVFEDVPEQSHLHFDILISLYGDWFAPKIAQQTTFTSEDFYTYLLLKEGADATALEAKLPAFVKKYINSDPITKNNIFRMSLMPLTDIHLYGHMGNEAEFNGNVTYIYLFETIALFVLIIACINFMNMSTARSGNRAKEVGIRKVMGSLRGHLVRQFLAESILITVCAIILAVGFVYLFIPAFNNISGKNLELPMGNPLLYVLLVVITLGVGILAGIYPSFILSAFKPVNVLKGRAVTGLRNGRVMSALVVFQFMISFILIIGAIAVNRQLAFIQNTNLGFEKEQLLLIKDAYVLRPNVESFRNRAKALPAVTNCSVSGFIPIENPESSRGDRTSWAAGKPATFENFVSLQDWKVDVDYIPTLGIEVVNGRAFSRDFPSDESAIILNEAAVIRFGLGEDPIGKKINTFSGTDGQPDFEHPSSRTVIGVVKNFHFTTLKETIAPLGLILGQSNGLIMVKMKTENIKESIDKLKSIWKDMAPDQPFQYSFADDDFNDMYSSESRLGQTFNIFSGLAIFIACLGLFALTAFTVEQRTKEIGIRKVLGASVGSILGLLVRDLGKLVFIAFVLTIPIAIYLVNNWLDSYSYKTEIGAIVYLTAGLSVFIIALLTMGTQSIKAALTNPVDSLRGD